MILLREVQGSDLQNLEHLSQIAAEKHPGFLNIANDKDQWRDKIHRSISSFAGTIENKLDAKYIFVIEDTETKKILGVSMVAHQHGTPETPHFYFEVGSEQKYAQSINTGFIHGTLKLRYETNGPTEIGGLLVDPDYRNSEEKIGRQISFVRFLYMGIHKSRFKRKILAELLPPLTKKGKSPLWEAVGRRFTNMDYTEADILSSKNKEFILSLFPSGKIYITFLTAEARNAIGKVSKETEPVMHMLKKIGFQYQNQVDPFDGGPHLVANIEDVSLIKNIKTLTYGGMIQGNDKSLVSGIVTPKASNLFKAVSVSVDWSVSEHKLYFDSDRASAIGLQKGDAVHFMPYY